MANVGERLQSLEAGQRETNGRLAHIDGHLTHIDRTLDTASKLFELMHARLEHIEDGQKTVIDRLERLEDGQRDFVEGQRLVIERLDRLIDATTRDRTVSIERLARIEQRLDAVERRLESSPPTT
jgi:hypothetical protein